MTSGGFCRKGEVISESASWPFAGAFPLCLAADLLALAMLPLGGFCLASRRAGDSYSGRLSSSAFDVLWR